MTDFCEFLLTLKPALIGWGIGILASILVSLLMTYMGIHGAPHVIVGMLLGGTGFLIGALKI